METEVSKAQKTAAPTPTQQSDASPEIQANKPGELRVIRRNGKVTPYDDSKIEVAMTKAFLAVEGGNAAASSRVHETVRQLTKQITEAFKRRMPGVCTVHIEVIQAAAVEYPNYGVAPGTVVMISQEHGLVVSSQNGCVRLDILACELGVLSGERLAHLIHLDAGERLNNSEFLQQQA